MLVATWNVNSIKQRLDNLTAWLAARQPDIVCLQETKCVDEAFPREPLEGLGYNIAVHGQKTFNGVAILSKLPFDEVTPRLPGDDADDHARFLEALVSTRSGVLRVASIYLPNGNPPNTDKYEYKLRWMERLRHYADRRLTLEEPLVLAGDYNVIPDEADVYDPPAWVDDALFQPQTRAQFPRAHQPRLHRRGARNERCARPVLVLGLSGGRVAAQQGPAHRPPAAVAAGGRPSRRGGDRQARARLGQAVGSRAGGGGARSRLP